MYIGIRTVYSIAKNNGFLLKKSVKGEHVFITGAGSGIGRQMAVILAKMGAKVTIADITSVFRILEKLFRDSLKSLNH